MFHRLFSIIDSLGSVPVLLHTLHDGKVTQDHLQYFGVHHRFLSIYLDCIYLKRKVGAGRIQAKKISLRLELAVSLLLESPSLPHSPNITWETERQNQKGFHKAVLFSKDNPRRQVWKQECSTSGSRCRVELRSSSRNDTSSRCSFTSFEPM